MLSLILAVSIIVTAFIPVFAAQAQGITSGSTYMLKNKASNKYLTVPRFTDTEKNVYQSTAKINDEYFRAVRVTYTAGRYILTPLIYETLGQGYIVSDSGDNVYCSTVSTNEAWSIEYVVGEGGYKITDRSGKALTAVGLSNGSVSDSSINAGGNIIVAEYSGADNQIWYFESVTVNPHMVKNELITKKNLGTGAEWLLCLSASEMNSPNVSIVDIEVSRESLVTVQQFGKWLLVRMNEDTVTPNDATDHYAIIKISLNNGVQRLVIIQDAGTGSNDACRTIPFEENVQLHTIILDDNNPKKHVLTFRSNLGVVTIYKWEIKNQTNAIEFSQYDDQILNGTNYAIIDVREIGFAVITATDVSGKEYTVVIEVKSQNSDGTYRTSSDVKNVTNTEKQFELKFFRSYLFHIDDSVTASSNWMLYNQYDDPVQLIGNDEFFVFDYYTPEHATIVTTGCQVSITQAEGAIIILPGMMGSQIFAGEDIWILGNDNIPNKFDEGTRLWDPDSSIPDAINANEKVLALAMDETGDPVYETYVNAPVVNDYDNEEDGFQYGSMDIYRNVYNQLYEDYYEYGYDIILYEYDWRYDTYDISLQLWQRNPTYIIITVTLKCLWR